VWYSDIRIIVAAFWFCIIANATVDCAKRILMRRSTVLALLIHLLAVSLHAQEPQRLLSAVKEWTKTPGEPDSPAFRYAFTDLDGDGRADAVVLLRGRVWCGSGGCNMLVFHGTDSGFKFVSSSELVKEPVRVLPEKTSGWKDLIVHLQTGGDVVMRFDGTSYPPDPSGPVATTAQIKAAQILMEPCCVSLYTSEAQFEIFHEPGWVKLKDGQNLHVSFRNVGGLTKPDVEKWFDGRRLLIIYSAEEGAGLLDPESLKSAPILDGLKEHPIDAMADKCMQSEAKTTQEMVTCYSKGLAMWDKELNRYYKQLTGELSPEQKQAVQTAQREWLQYRDAEKAAFDAVDNDRTLSRVSRAKEAMSLTKEQAERLARLLAR
jgi:uncharacterized protein YecT (DUF1311 family)